MKQVLLKVVLVGISVAIPLALIEAFLIWDHSFERVGSHIREINGIGYDFVEPTDRLATPDPETRRVMLVGDSFTAGRNCAANGENVIGHLERLVGDRDLDLVNLGVDGRDGAHLVEIVEDLRSGVGPGDDMIVILYDNDIHLTEESCRLIDRQSAEHGITMPGLCTDILAGAARPLDQDTMLKRLNQRLDEVRTFNLVKEAAYNIPFLRGLYTRGTHVSKWEDLDSDEYRWMVDSITLMHDLVEEQGADFTLAYYPNINAITATDPRHAIWRTFIEALEDETGITTLDPFPFFIENTPSTSLVWSLTDKHPNCTAHGLMARYLLETVIDRPVADKKDKEGRGG